MSEATPEMTFAADELLNLAIMTKMPVLIVEGIDDIPIYERLSLSVNVDCDVYAAATLSKGREGCRGVLDNISEIRNAAEGLPVEKFVLGIIDRDARFYRNELDLDPAIFSLNYYSIESHYVSACSVEFLIPRFTSATKKLISPEMAKIIFDSIFSEISYLYYVSLEALKNACDQAYTAEFGYSDSIKSIINRGLHMKVMDKKSELDAFAKGLNLSFSLETMLKICKGKWVGEIYSDHLYSAMLGLPGNCMLEKVPQCQACSAGEPQKCLYRKTSFFSSDILMHQAFHNTEAQYLGYIKAKIKDLSVSCRAA